MLGAGWAATCALLVMRALVLPWPYLDGRLSDFAAYHGAAVELLAGHSPWSRITYIYPAPLAILLLPLGLVGYVLARRLFFALSIACLLAAAALLARGESGLRRLWPFASLAAIGAVSENLVLGQVQPLLLLVLVGAWSSRRRPLGEGGLYGLAAAIKVWPGLLLAVPALGRRWRSVAAGVGVIVAGVVLTVLVGLLPGPSAPPSLDYALGTPALLNGSAAGVAMRALTLPEAGAELPRSWHAGGGALQTLRTGRSARLLAAAATAAALAVGLLALLAGRLAGADHAGEPFRLGIVLTTGLLAVPVSWYHYELLHWLTLALVVPAVWARARGAAVAIVLAVLAASWAAPTVIAAYVGAYGWSAAHPLLLICAGLVIPAANVAVLAATASAAARREGVVVPR